jgi:hypothetical protein
MTSSLTRQQEMDSVSSSSSSESSRSLQSSHSSRSTFTDCRLNQSALLAKQDALKSEGPSGVPSGARTPVAATSKRSLSDERLELQVEDLSRRKNFILAFANAMASYGAPANRIERRTMKVATALGLANATTVSVVGSRLVIVGFFDAELKVSSDTHVLKISPGLLQFHLDLTDALTDRLKYGDFDFECLYCRSSCRIVEQSTRIGSVTPSVVAARSQSLVDEDELLMMPYAICTDVDPVLALYELNRIASRPMPWSRPALVVANMVSSFVTPFFWSVDVKCGAKKLLFTLRTGLAATSSTRSSPLASAASSLHLDFWRAITRYYWATSTAWRARSCRVSSPH